MDTAVALVLLAVSLATCLPLAAVTKTIKCHGDICNRGTDNQFCSTYFEMCRSCSDIVLDCGTDIQPSECTPYCIAYKVQLELEKTKAISCMLYKTFANGFVSPYQNESGHVAINTTVTFSCQTGFELQGVKTKTCLGDNEWTEKDDPVCISQSYKVWRNIGIALAASTIILIIMIAVLSIVIYRRTKGHITYPKNAPESASKSDFESGIDMSCQDETSLLMNPAKSTAQQQDITGKDTSTTDNKSNVDEGNQSATADTLPPSQNSNPHIHDIPSQPVAGNIVTVSLHMNNELNGSNQSESKTISGRREHMHRQVSDTCTNPTLESQETVKALQETNEDASCKGIIVDQNDLDSAEGKRSSGRSTDRGCVPTGK